MQIILSTHDSSSYPVDFKPVFKNFLITLVLFVCAPLIWAHDASHFHAEKNLPETAMPDDHDKLFPFERLSIDVTDYFTEANLKFDADMNPSGIFTSDDHDTGSASDALARQELLALNTSGKKSLISYVDVGDPEADPIVLFHGVPTSMFEWRDVILYLEKHARVIAFDQIGQGYSSKHKTLTYTYKQQLAYVEAFFAALQLDQKKTTLVVTDTGGSLGFAYAMRHPENIKGLAFFETVFGPVPSLDMMTKQAQVFRSPEGNEEIITQNTFVENLIVHASEVVPPNDTPFTIRPFTDAEIRAYKFPYLNQDHRKVLARWVLEIPFMGGAPDGYGDTNLEIWSRFAGYLMTNPVPKLYLFAEPGMLNTLETSHFVMENFNTDNSLSSINLGLGYHFLQEDYPEEVGQAIAQWYQLLP